MVEASVLNLLFVVASMYGLMLIARDFFYWLKYLPRRILGFRCCAICTIWDSVGHWFGRCHRLPRATIIRGVEFINEPVKVKEEKPWWAD
jgi:hypothetical protein